MTDKTRVLLAIGSLHFGGAERVVANLAKGLNRDLFDVHVVCTRALGRVSEELIRTGVPVSIVSTGSGVGRRFAPLALLRFVRRLKPDVIHTHGVVALAAAGPLGLIGALPPWIHSFHYGNYPYPKRRQMWMERVFCRGASRLIAVADAQREAILRYHRVPTNRIATLLNGVHPNPHLSDESIRAKKRLEFGLTDNDFVIGSVAVLSEQKGIRHLLGAVRALAGRRKNVKVLIVGGGPLEAELRRLATESGLDGTVHFTGWRSDVSELLMAFDVFVMSSLWEAMPLTLLEAMAAAKAIVVTDVGDNSRLTRHEVSALVVPPGDAVGLATALERLSADADLRTRLATTALREFNDKYTVERMVRRHEDLYLSLKRD